MSAETSQSSDAAVAAPQRRSADPEATYRLQLGEDLTFADVVDLLDYLVTLGVTDLYLSPILRARIGSFHGYDVVDPTQVSPALGGVEGLRALSDAAAARGIGVIVDIVPNHLAMSDENPLWEQVLAEGVSGPAGSLFDIDWRPRLPTAEGKVILPLLDDTYGVTLTAGELELVRVAGGYRLRYRDRTFPLSRESLDMLDGSGGVRAFAGTAGALTSWQSLHGLLERQHYRLVHWRVGDAVVNYRRFFTVDDLVAVRVEVPEVFERTHAVVLELANDGVISGLRVDHPDGLRDPERYLQQLRNRTGVWIVAEKILHPGERLPAWTVAGTTGYDFCNDVLGLYTDAAAIDELRALDEKLGGGRPYAEHAIEGKRAVLHGGLCADLERVAQRLWNVSQQHPQVRDVTLEWCRRVLAGTLEQFGVYRTYVDPETGTAHETDRTQIATAIERARAADDEPPAVLWDFVEQLLSGEVGTGSNTLDVVARFQQLCGAVTAKGTEDTAFYRYRTLLAINEVGGDPARPGRSVEQFQQHNADRAERWPLAMLTTATHDTKRGEDARLRMAAITEAVPLWGAAVDAWEQQAETSTLPAQSRYLVYQTVVGVWPLDGDPADEHRDRLAAYAVKAEREAGLYTTWTDPDTAFEERLEQFARSVLDAAAAPDEVQPLLDRVAEIAMVAGLGQVVLRTLSPGVPDCYQGTEVWDDALVDPDNRRPVAFDDRRALLDGLADVDVDELLAQRRDGRIKAFVLQRALQSRAQHPGCVGMGSGYLPLEVSGELADHVVAFARVSSDAADALLVVAPRLPGAVMGDEAAPTIGEVWGHTAVRVPGFLQGTYRDVFSVGSGEIGDTIEVSSLLANLPVAVLERTGDADD
ncbi:MAG: malto-oligosyltrehalose synthase [Actinobacteria bacterium]|nr:malto-oligosyltrehalose synthase [Actinomycetota bacterium]